MDLDTLAKLGEFLGGFFVVLSLVYLAHQVRQNTKSLRTENYARVLDRMSTVQSRLSTDRELNRVVVIGATTPGALTRGERVRFTWALYELFGAAEFMYHQALDKALPAQVWKRWEASITWWLSSPGFQLWWKAKPASFSTDFEKFVKDIMLAGRVDKQALRRWEAFVSGEGLPQRSDGEPSGMDAGGEAAAGSLPS